MIKTIVAGTLTIFANAQLEIEEGSKLRNVKYFIPGEKIDSIECKKFDACVESVLSRNSSTRVLKFDEPLFCNVKLWSDELRSKDLFSEFSLMYHGVKYTSNISLYGTLPFDVILKNYFVGDDNALLVPVLLKPAPFFDDSKKDICADLILNFQIQNNKEDLKKKLDDMILDMSYKSFGYSQNN